MSILNFWFLGKINLLKISGKLSIQSRRYPAYKIVDYLSLQ